MPHAIVIPLVSAGIPACIVWLWAVWWISMCGGCGEQHKACACPARDHMMRPRR